MGNKTALIGSDSFSSTFKKSASKSKPPIKELNNSKLK